MSTNRLAKIVAETDGVEKHVFVRRVQEALSARERLSVEEGAANSGIWGWDLLPGGL